LRQRRASERATWWRREQRVTVAAARAKSGGDGGTSRDERNEKLHTRREEKDTRPFPDPAYIHRLTDEYRRARTIRLAPAYIHRFSVNTNEYKFIFVGFRTDEYNLNIFISTNKYNLNIFVDTDE
jgi:hypothetical protein